MDMTMMMVEVAIGQAAGALAESYQGARDRDTLIAAAKAKWSEKGAGFLELLGGEFDDLVVDEELAARCEDMFIEAFLASLHQVGARAGHTPLSLSWERIGDAATTDDPPPAVSPDNYFLCWDGDRFLYALSHDHHQFGHLWAYDANAPSWTQVSDRAYRGGSIEQAWTGTYDRARSGVLGWAVDSGAPVGVLVGEAGLTVLGSADLESYGDDPFDTITFSGEVPTELDGGEWSDLAAVFGIDRSRNVWVMLAPQGIYEFDLSNAWKRIGDLDPSVLPDDVSGDRSFSNGGAGAVWDARKSELVFWFSSEESLHFVSWDGERLAPIGNEGLPEALMPSFESQGAVVGEHAQDGIVVYAGAERGLFTRADAGWVASKPGKNPPPPTRGTSLAFSEGGGALLGPGHYPSDEGNFEAQKIFFSRPGGRWRKLGVSRRKSMISRIRDGGGWPVMGAADGRVVATGWRQTLATIEWKENGWHEVVSAEAGAAAFASGSSAKIRAGLVAGDGDRLVAISSNGAVFALDDGVWSTLASDAEAFAERRDFCAVYSPAHRGIVMYGGDKGEQKTNDTLLYADGRWQALPPSRRSPDLAYNYDHHGFAVDFALVYDTALGAPLRLGFEELAVLSGNEWVAAAPPFIRDYLEPHHRALVHDAQTGETLVVLFGAKTIVRLDLGGFDLVATFEAPAIESRFPFRDWIYDPASRTIVTFNEDDDAERYRLELSGAFELARSIGPRVTTFPSPPPPPVRLYKPQDGPISVFYADVEGGEVVVRGGRLGGPSELERMQVDDGAAELRRLERERRASGWVDAQALDGELLRAAIATPAWPVEIGGAPTGNSRVGGLPNLGDNDWPEDEDGEPMGCLLQIELPERLGGGGIAVFCVTSGIATEDEDNNRAIRLSAADLAAAPTRAPKGALPLAARPIRLGPESQEISRQAADKLGSDDPALGERIEALTATMEISTGSKIGGCAVYLQGAMSSAPLAFQIDAGDLAVEDGGWDDAGLFGVLYVHDPDDPEASWQYT